MSLQRPSDFSAKIFQVSNFFEANKIFLMLAQDFLKILLVNPGESQQLYNKICKLATCLDTSVW